MTQQRSISVGLRKLVASPWADRWLLAQVFMLLGVAWLALRIVPFRRLARYLGPLQAETPVDAPPNHLAEARRIAQAIARVSPYTPWTSNCFPQALVAKFWLGRRGIPSTLYLGVLLTRAGNDRSAPPGMDAHAWLRCGPFLVTGGRGHERYTIVARFGG